MRSPRLFTGGIGGAWLASRTTSTWKKYKYISKRVLQTFQTNLHWSSINFNTIELLKRLIGTIWAVEDDCSNPTANTIGAVSNLNFLDRSNRLGEVFLYGRNKFCVSHCVFRKVIPQKSIENQSRRRGVENKRPTNRTSRIRKKTPSLRIMRHQQARSER